VTRTQRLTRTQRSTTESGSATFFVEQGSKNMDKAIISRAAAIAVVVFGCSSTASAQQAVAKAPVRKVVRSVQGFNVVLVLGDLENGPAPADDVPVAARKALGDMKDFLPYKSYRLLDTAWILSADDSRNATSRLRGPDEREYELTLGATAESSGAVSNRTLRVTFQLRDSALRQVTAVHDGSPMPSLDYTKAEMARDAARRAVERDAAARNAQVADLEKRRDGLQVELRALTENLSEKQAQVAGTKAELDRLVEQLAALRAREGADAVARERARLDGRLLEFRSQDVVRTRIAAQPALRIIDTGFTMEVGETVVVGTSRVRGEKAIIALLTAVPRGARK
jgi:hypothetical protein